MNLIIWNSLSTIITRLKSILLIPASAKCYSWFHIYFWARIGSVRNINGTSNSRLITRWRIKINARYAVTLSIQKVIYIHIYTRIHFQGRLQWYLIYFVCIVVVFLYWTPYFEIFVYSLILFSCCVKRLLLFMSEFATVVIKRSRWKRVVMLVGTALFLYDEFRHEGCRTVLLVLCSSAESLLLTLVLNCLWITSWEIISLGLFL